MRGQGMSLCGHFSTHSTRSTSCQVASRSDPQRVTCLVRPLVAGLRLAAPGLPSRGRAEGRGGQERQPERHGITGSRDRGLDE